MIEALKEIDQSLFLSLNSMHSGFWDQVMYWTSLRYTWIPLYVLLLYLVYRRFGKQTLVILISVAVLILFSDQFSVLVKNSVQRFRPCHEPELQQQVHTLSGKCGGSYGFVSSHASNTFALAMFLSMLFSRVSYFPLLIFFWAMFVSYSRIYSGVHYPLDIAGGAMLGMTLAFLIFLFYKRIAPMICKTSSS